MCAVCDAKNALKKVIEELEASAADIAGHFTALIDYVTNGGHAYSADRDENAHLKVRIFTLATEFARGFLPTTSEAFMAKIEAFDLPRDSHYEVRQGMKKAMVELYGHYGNRLPWALYGGYMFMASRTNITVAERLPDIRDQLPSDLSWECIDAVWHGYPPSTVLYLDILSVINRHTRTVPLHGCGCNHYLPPVPLPDADAAIRIEYPAPVGDNIRIETEVPVAHAILAIESLVRGLPHALGTSDKALNHHADKGAKTLVRQLIPETAIA